MEDKINHAFEIISRLLASPTPQHLYIKQVIVRNSADEVKSIDLIQILIKYFQNVHDFD